MKRYTFGDLFNMTIYDLRNLLLNRDTKVVIFIDNSQLVYEGTFNGITSTNTELDNLKVLSVEVNADYDWLSIHAFSPKMAY